MSLTTKKRTLEDAPTPETGEVTLFVDIADDVLKAKLPDGTSASVTGAGGGGGGDAELTPVGWAVITLADGMEAVTHQVGDVITGVNVIGTGEYEVTIAPGANLDDDTRVGVHLTAVGADRFCSHFPELGSNKITVYVRNAAGTAVAAARVTMTLWYLPEAP